MHWQPPFHRVSCSHTQMWGAARCSEAASLCALLALSVCSTCLPNDTNTGLFPLLALSNGALILDSWTPLPMLPQSKHYWLTLFVLGLFITFSSKKKHFINIGKISIFSFYVRDRILGCQSSWKVYLCCRKHTCMQMLTPCRKVLLLWS